MVKLKELDLMRHTSSDSTINARSENNIRTCHESAVSSHAESLRRSLTGNEGKIIGNHAFNILWFLLLMLNFHIVIIIQWNFSWMRLNMSFLLRFFEKKKIVIFVFKNQCAPVLWMCAYHSSGKIADLMLYFFHFHTGTGMKIHFFQLLNRYCSLFKMHRNI